MAGPVAGHIPFQLRYTAEQPVTATSVHFADRTEYFQFTIGGSY